MMEWKVMQVILTSKGLIFCTTVLMTISGVSSPKNALLALGIFIIMSTQGNDLALGFPVISKLFPPTKDANGQVEKQSNKIKIIQLRKITGAIRKQG
jgi:hypothetical protein